MKKSFYFRLLQIPWSKFHFGHNGWVQDNQDRVPLNMATGLSITLKDRVDGPYSLEIDYIGFKLDSKQVEEEFRYTFVNRSTYCSR